ncbi:MAG: biopolymer transporter ExbD [Rhodobacterales bacterium CG18_big_fil_WC_8_21_14_2_50_71_9]|nr:MAG: biopolymer transporter ExbD [Rhodobacterales bacterium CG18_big_fil_WC_8_21_14_2_50_71_9]
MAQGRGLRPARRRRALIGLTPLIDVVFILLIFFMLASRLGDWRGLPVVSAPGGGGGMAGAVLLELRADGLRLSGAPLDAAALAARLPPGRRVLLRAGDGVTMQALTALLDRLEALGVRDVTLLEAAR